MRYTNWLSEVIHRMKRASKAVSTTLKTITGTFLNQQKSVNTKVSYQRDMNQFIAFLGMENETYGNFMAFEAHELHDTMVEFLNSCMKRNEQGHILNGNTLNRKRYTLVSFFRFLVEVYDYPKNPAVNLPRFKKSEWSNTPRLEEGEIKKLMRFLKGRRHRSETAFRNYLIILGLFHFALRRKELAGLKWSDIQHSPPHFQIYQKGGRKKLLPIPPKYLERLHEYAEAFGKPSRFLFHPTFNNRTKTIDKPLSVNQIFSIVKKLGEKVLPNREIMPHSFRATFVSLAREYGIDDRQIMNATGHTSSSMINFYDTRDRLRANAIHFFGEWIE